MRTPLTVAGSLLGLVALTGGVARQQRTARARRLAVEPADVGLDATVITLRSLVDTDLHGWWIPRPGDDGTPAPTVLVVHGYASHASDLLPVAPVLHRAGMHVLLVDLRGHGRSEAAGSWSPPPLLAEDVGVALDWLTERDDVGGLGVLGHSMGGSLAILASAGRSDVDAVVTVAAVADPTLTRIGVWPGAVNRAFLRAVGRRRGVDPSRMFAVNRIGDVTAPVLLVHGEDDRVVPSAHAFALASNRPDAEVVVVPGAGHAKVDAFAPTFERVTAFLAEHCNHVVDAA